MLFYIVLDIFVYIWQSDNRCYFIGGTRKINNFINKFMDEINNVLNFKNNKILFATSFDDTNVLNRKQLIDAIINNFQTGNYEVKYNVLLDCPTPFCELDLFVGNLCKTISEHYGCKTCKTWNDVVFASKTTEDGMEVISVVFNIGFEKPKN